MFRVVLASFKRGYWYFAPFTLFSLSVKYRFFTFEGCKAFGKVYYKGFLILLVVTFGFKGGQMLSWCPFLAIFMNWVEGVYLRLVSVINGAISLYGG